MEKTVGQASYELQQKSPEKINVIDMQREMQKSVMKEIEKIISEKKDYASEYFILYMIQRERLMPNVIRQRFITRKSRPLPHYDSSLFSYDNKKCELKFHWSIPDEETCVELLHKENPDPEDLELLSYVKAFSEGTLY